MKSFSVGSLFRSLATGRAALAGALAAFALALSATAAPVDYNRVYLESSIASSPTAHTEIELLAVDEVVLDSTADTIEFGANLSFEAIRAFDLADASSDGASFLTQTNSAANNCDGMPPCPESLSIVGGYLTLADMAALYRPKGLLAPNDEVFFGVQAFEGRSQGESSYLGFESMLSKPATLALGDVQGTYRLVSYNNELARDFVGGTEETASIGTVNLTLNGDGTCSGGVVAGGGLRQSTFWPMLDSRSSVEAEINGVDDFQGCSYTVDAASGEVNLVLQIFDGGDTFSLPLSLFVSAERRYLAGRLVEETSDGNQTGSELNTFVGVRLGSAAVSNTDLVGSYFMSTFGETFSGAESLGIDADFVTRTVLSFEGGAADGEGFNSCSIVDRAYAGTLRSLGGSAPSPSTSSVVFSGNDTSLVNDCRYRVDSATSATLELIAQGVPSQIALGLSDDQQTLVGARLVTSGDPLDPGFVEELAIPSVGMVEMLVLQRYSGAPQDAAARDFVAPIAPDLNANVALAASVLPGSRSVQQGEAATAFASVINFGTEAGIGCDIRYGGTRSLAFSFQETLANNAPTGNRNQGVDIAAGSTQTFFFEVRPFEPFSSEEIELDFSCLNSSSALPIIGLNTLLLSSTLSPGPDIVALGATVSNDGIARLTGGSGFFTLASFNVGAQDAMTVSADTGTASLPLAVTLCQSDPATSACINPTVPTSAPVSVTIDSGDTPTFAVFVSASDAIALDPANKRIFVRFNDSTGVVRGSTSVAVQTE